MGITYPLAWPAGIHPKSVTVKVLDVVGFSSSPFSKAQQIYDWDADIWQAEVVFPRYRRAQAAALVAWLLSLRGVKGAFTLGPDRAAATPRGSVAGAPLVDGASQAGRTLATKGWTPSQSGVLLAGDYFQLGSGSTARLHMALADASSDGSGKATLDIWPKLRTSPADSATIVTSNPVGLWRLASNARQWELTPPDRYEMSILCQEAL